MTIEKMSNPFFSTTEAPRIHKILARIRDSQPVNDFMVFTLFDYAMDYKKRGSFLAAMTILYELLSIIPIPYVVAEFYTIMYMYSVSRGNANLVERVCSALETDLKTMQKPELFRCKASILVDHGKYDEAIEVLQQSLKLHPHDASTTRLLASVFNRLHRNEEALVVLDQYIKRKKKDPKALELKGSILSEIGKFKDAKKCFEKASKIDKSEIRYRLMIAAMYSKMRDMPKARSIINNLLEYMKGTGSTWRNMGVFYSNHRFLDLAEYCFEKAVLLSPKEPEYVRDLTIVYRKKGELEKAIKFVRSKLRFHKGSDRVLRVLADMYLEDGQFDKAEQYACEALEVKPDDAWLFVMLGDILLHKKDEAGSERAFDKAVELSRQHPNIRVKISMMYWKHLDIKRAERILEEVLDEHPTHRLAMACMRFVKEASSMKVSMQKLYKQLEPQILALASGELPPKKDGYRLHVNIFDALADDQEDSLP